MELEWFFLTFAGYLFIHAILGLVVYSQYKSNVKNLRILEILIALIPYAGWFLRGYFFRTYTIEMVLIEYILFAILNSGLFIYRIKNYDKFSFLKMLGLSLLLSILIISIGPALSGDFN